MRRTLSLLPRAVAVLFLMHAKSVYTAGWVLFNNSDPTKVLARADKPIFNVEREWEKAGQVLNVVFVEGMVTKGSRWFFYYGCADKYIGAVAETR